MKISICALLAFALLWTSDANLGDGVSDRSLRGSFTNEQRGLVPTTKTFNTLRCRTGKVDIRLCIKTDGYPRENKVRVYNEHDTEGLRMGPFDVGGKTYCEVEQCCPGNVSMPFWRLRVRFTHSQSVYGLWLIFPRPFSCSFVHSLTLHVVLFVRKR